MVRVPSSAWGLVGLLLILFPTSGTAQELDCRVQIDDSQLSGAESEFDFLSDLERKIQEYMNTRSWTDDQFLRHERISCSMQIVILESISISEFRSRLIVTSRRPIYGTTQSSVVVRVNDPEWRFEFSRGSTLNFDLDRYDPLTSVLDFYAYLILGYDYDTFSPLGGTSYFEKARTVTDQAELADAVLVTGFPHSFSAQSSGSEQDNLSNFARLTRASRGVRRLGSAALDLAYVAAGRLDGFWEYFLNPWDTAAGYLMVGEAGGRITDVKGDEYHARRPSIVATNGELHASILSNLEALE